MSPLPHPIARLRRCAATALTAALLVLAFPISGAAATMGHGPDQYTVVAGAGTFTPLPAGDAIGAAASADDQTYDLTLPFTYRFYHTTYPAGTTIQVSTNGNIQFRSADSGYDNGPFPYPTYGDAILGLQTDLMTRIYAATSGTAPHRVLTVEYRGGYYSAPDQPVDLEIRLFEDSRTRYFDVTYRTLDETVEPGTVGVQEGTGSSYTQYAAEDPSAIRPGMRLTFYDSADPPPPSLQPLDAVVRTIALGGAPSALAVDNQTGHAFVANSVEGSVTMLDTRSGATLHMAPVGRVPVALAVDGTTGRVFAANSRGDSVSVLDAASGKLLHTVAVGAAPVALAVDAARGHVFVADRDADTVDVLDATSGAVVTATLVGRAPNALALDAARGRVFVAYSGATAITVLDAASGRVLDTIALPARPVFLAVDGATGRVIVATNGPDGAGRVVLVDEARDAIVHTTRLQSSIAGLVVASVAGRIAVAGMDGRLRLLDAQTGAVLSTVDAPDGAGGMAARIGVDAAHGALLVATPGRTDAAHRYSGAGLLRVLDARDGSVRGFAILGHSPALLSVDGAAGRVLIADNADNTLTVLDANRLASTQ